MASLKASSRRSSSSSLSFHTSARYSSSSSSSSSFRTPGPDSREPSSFLDQDHPPGVGPHYLAHFHRPSRTSALAHSGPTGVSALGRGPSSGGEVHLLGDSYYTSADVSRFQPQDVAIMAYNNQVVIHAEKVMEDGSICDTFTHKSLLPDDMDPLSLRGTLSSDGVLVVSVQRLPCAGVGGARLPEPPDARPVPHNFAFDP